MNNQKLKIEEGTINFWIEENKVTFNDNKIYPLVSVSPEGGSIFIVKDNDNKLKAFYVVLKKGRIDLNYDVSAIDPERRHMVTFTWSLQNKKLALYLDSQNVVEKNIDFK